MSGIFASTGMLTNEGNNFLDIKNDLDHQIKNLIIHNIPLSTSNAMTALRTIGKITSPLIHSALSPTLSHIAIQLDLEDSDFIYIIEYGQYYSKDSKIENNFFNTIGSNSSKAPRKSKNNHDYYYINEDGVRITRLSYKEVETRLINENMDYFALYKLLSIFKTDNLEVEYKKRAYNMKSMIISEIIAEEFYGEIDKEKNQLAKISNNFYRINCDIKNKITLRELCNNFKNDKWLAKKYNVVTHNCQIFAAEVIKILKAIRINEADKIRTNEKIILPNCLIKALWDNEELSLTNTLGRIPVFGLFHDLAYNIAHSIKK